METAAVLLNSAAFAGNPGRALRHAIAHCEEKRYDAAITEVKHALRSEPRNPDLLITAGYAYLANGKTRDAMEVCDAAVRIAPDYSLAYFCRGRVFAALGQQRAFLSDAVEGVKLDSREPSSGFSTDALALAKLQYQATLVDLENRASSPATVSAYGQILRGRIQDINSRLSAVGLQ